MLSVVISQDIVRYILTKERYTHQELADLMGLIQKDIDNIAEGHKVLPKASLTLYLSSTNTRFWKLAYNAIPQRHCPKSTWDKISLCKQISDHLKNKK